MNFEPSPSKLDKFGLFRNNTNRKFKSRARIVLLSLAGILGAAGILAAASSKLFVPFYQEFRDPNGHFANLNLGGPTDTTKSLFSWTPGRTAAAALLATRRAMRGQ